MKKRTQQFFAFGFGVTFVVTMLILAIALPNPTLFQYTIFRVVLALATAGVAAMIPGFIEIEIPNWLRAGGALAVFVVVYFYNPASLVAPLAEKSPPTVKENTQIPIGNVSGDVVISQNQSGGITAHSVNINETVPPDWSINPSEKINDSEWRTKLSARGRGRLPYSNWNLLLTLNTEVIRREDVPGEVTVGPWMPLSVRGGNLQPNHFFIGFSEFKPSQALSIYLYSREPLKVLRVDTLSE